jgi:heme-degrading monooxygenase HmoA
VTDDEFATPTPPPDPPYLAVIFTSLRRPGDGDDGYADAAARMLALAAGRPGFLGVDSARGPDGLGITVSYWRDEASIAAWRDDAEHAAARRQGRRAWYDSSTVHVARVERSYRFP